MLVSQFGVGAFDVSPILRQSPNKHPAFFMPLTPFLSNCSINASPGSLAAENDGP